MNPSQPFFSIIMPIYNVEACLEIVKKTIETLVNFKMQFNNNFMGE